MCNYDHLAATTVAISSHSCHAREREEGKPDWTGKSSLSARVAYLPEFSAIDETDGRSGATICARSTWKDTKSYDSNFARDMNHCSRTRRAFN